MLKYYILGWWSIWYFCHTLWHFFLHTLQPFSWHDIWAQNGRAHSCHVLTTFKLWLLINGARNHAKSCCVSIQHSISMVLLLFSFTLTFSNLRVLRMVLVGHMSVWTGFILGLVTASFVDAPMLFFFVCPLSPFSPVSDSFSTGVCQNHFLFTYKGVGARRDSSSWGLITLLTQFKLFWSSKEEEQQISQLMNWTCIALLSWVGGKSYCAVQGDVEFEVHWNVSPVAYPTGPFGQLFFVVCVSVSFVLFFPTTLFVVGWSFVPLWFCCSLFYSPHAFPTFCPFFSIFLSLSPAFFLCVFLSPLSSSFPTSMGHWPSLSIPLSPPLWVYLCPTSLSSSLFLLLSFCMCSPHPSLSPSLPPWVTDPRSPSPCLPLSGSIYVQLFLPHLLSCPVTSLPVCEPVCLSFSVCVNTFVFILLSFSVCVDTLLCSRSRPRQRFQMLWNVCQSCHFMYHWLHVWDQGKTGKGVFMYY